ncbi:uncharacterized protein Nmlp_2243 [Natronomonas moolapensis 8.8.11]|uniref:Uncharacterized protein n=1 Tax=Natronomonas moolapensis (strain DSM 18674 / CECT 7526 / JCM 14361 / 8.8.11) TaxID=268739 RepID=M1XKS3_NATM8|nr:hypothetical protein [Natronomonas moolapensis]CCQ36415.1 uncharacterized protein Nmlp_2243 [Natronomonas moolapensis 8.8.11]
MRGQAHTVEAFVAAVLVVSGLVFATQAAAVTPLSASTSNQHIENQQQATVEGLLAASADNGNLTEAVLYWNASADDGDGAFAGAPESGTYATGPQNGFGADLNGTLSSRQIAFNVVVRYPDGDDTGTDTEPMVRMGEPSDNAVSATRTVGLYDESKIKNGTSLGDLDDDEFYAPDANPDSQLYTVVEVEVIAWRK